MMLALEINEVFDRPIEAVWRAITDPRKLARWLMSNDFEARVGHRFTLREPSTTAWRGWFDCEVLELEPPRRMVWSWFGGLEGESVTRVVFELRAEGRSTHLTLRHEGEASSERSGALGSGWKRRLALIHGFIHEEVSS